MIPPLAISVIVMYIYQQYVNVLFFYKKTTYILIASVFSAVCNIILNVIFDSSIWICCWWIYFFSKLFTYYDIVFCISEKRVFYKRICMKTYFNTKLQMIILLTTSMVALFITAIYKNLIMRYMIVLSILIFIIVAGKKDILLGE